MSRENKVHEGRIKLIDSMFKKRVPIPPERVKGVEPSSPVWKTGALTVELHPHCRHIISSSKGLCVIGFFFATVDLYSHLLQLSDAKQALG